MVPKGRDRSLVRRRAARAVHADARPDRPVLGPVIIKIAISEVAFEAVARAIPLGSVSYDKPNERGERFVWLSPNVVNRLRAMRVPGETYRDVIFRLAGETPRQSARLTSVEDADRAAPSRSWPARRWVRGVPPVPQC
jgi:hypothetical protein